MIRIQRKRTKGWRLPPGAIIVSRPSRWGNPWHIAPDGSIGGRFRPDGSAWSMDDVLRWYRGFVSASVMDDPTWVAPLRGATALACWCSEDQPCHADVLIELLEAAA
jgi:hypothetical protein